MDCDDEKPCDLCGGEFSISPDDEWSVSCRYGSTWVRWCLTCWLRTDAACRGTEDPAA